jgi:hypothetical protein
MENPYKKIDETEIPTNSHSAFQQGLHHGFDEGVLACNKEWMTTLDRIKRFAEIWELNPIPREKLYPLLVEFLESLKKEMETK